MNSELQGRDLTGSVSLTRCVGAWAGIPSDKLGLGGGEQTT
jgi:hypothetical protein